MIVTLLAKTQLYELTIIAAYNGDMSEAIDYYIGLCWKWKVYFITSN